MFRVSCVWWAAGVGVSYTITPQKQKKPPIRSIKLMNKKTLQHHLTVSLVCVRTRPHTSQWHTPQHITRAAISIASAYAAAVSFKGPHHIVEDVWHARTNILECAFDGLCGRYAQLWKFDDNLYETVFMAGAHRYNYMHANINFKM